MEGRRPVRGHVLVREVFHRQSVGGVEKVLRDAALAEVPALDCLEGARRRETGLGLHVAAAVRPDTGLVDQPLHSQRALPCREGVVAEVYQAARARLGRQQSYDAGTDVVADPRPEAVHGYEVGLGNGIALTARCELREI